MSGMDRYDRQTRIEGWDQNLLFSSTVFIAGVGAIGGEVAKNLTMMGIGKLVLADYDFVELSNLSRQLLFRDSDLGKSKAAVAAERLREINPHVEVEAFGKDIRVLTEDVFRSVDVIFSCLDNWASRRWLNSVAVSLNKPLIDGSMNGFYGNVQAVLPRRTACLECQSINLIPREEKEAECTLKRRNPEHLVNDLKELGIEVDVGQAEKLFQLNIKTVYDIKYARLETITSVADEGVLRLLERLRSILTSRLPAIQSVAAVVAGIMTTVGVKLLHGGKLGAVPTGLIVYDGLSSRLSRVRISRDPLCIVCGEDDATPVEFSFKLGESVLKLKEALASAFGFPDPEVLFGGKRLSDEEILAEVGVKSGDVIYVSTTRLFEPLPIKIISPSH
ncbi:MAG: ThiF family adenylyltransferase [Nitrososphaerota archaeon]|nr:ThiF family adenylyltransferase [Candidatus Calditenuaceae archaeon]MDW8073131.1 ThiF family adenylyltransferase [Nitrososphaerota archaeon]